MPSARTRHVRGVFAVGALLFAGACDRERPADPVILSLGQHEVRLSEFERHADEVAERGQAPLDPAVRQALLEAYLERRVLVLEARGRGLLGADATSEQEVDAVRKLLAADVLSSVEVSEAEVDQYYGEHPGEFVAPETVTVRQILVPTSNEARDVRRRLRRDGKSFAVLAQTMSRAPEASAGGLMGTFARGQLPSELESAAFALAPGQTSDVVQTPLGYHVLRTESRQPARQTPLGEARPAIRTRLLESKSDRKVREYVVGLMARAKVNHEAARIRR
ncbi:MAG TPA: peptidyl-prolyl cis-trans isomerase [Vicinamibacteria bacterium]|nr:peptidyl-prolyl cis-trans isomerase [Vicinamibacteria bacterium]